MLKCDLIREEKGIPPEKQSKNFKFRRYFRSLGKLGFDVFDGKHLVDLT